MRKAAGNISLGEVVKIIVMAMAVFIMIMFLINVVFKTYGPMFLGWLSGFWMTLNTK
ncbi:Uncharacterised protein [Candidatus Tiddalikarchaeum anstoanum]|nr:Uncharacterised protein [Candidatus Tiddalikarchaeum anstoanum]